MHGEYTLTTTQTPPEFMYVSVASVRNMNTKLTLVLLELQALGDSVI